MWIIIDKTDNSRTSKLKVHGGWIVRYEYWDLKEGEYERGSLRATLCYVPDPEYLWGC